MRQLIVVGKALFMAACAVLIFGFLTRAVRLLDGFIPLTLPPWVAVAGLVLILAGAILTFACFGLFAADGSLDPGPTFPDPTVFISRGPYRFVRNPMSKGGFTVLVGWGCYQRSPAIVAFGFLMLGLMHLFVVYVEEPKLELRFGQSYRDYRSRVERWIPRVGRLTP
jgi:protein-S-isoprenylcysteine O-methyltransferase Ste14